MFVVVIFFSLSGCITVSTDKVEGEPESSDKKNSEMISSDSNSENEEQLSKEKVLNGKFNDREGKKKNLSQRMGEIRQKLEDSPLLALQLYLNLEKEISEEQKTKNNSDFKELKTLITGSVAKDCRDALSDKDYVKAMALYNSLSLIKEEGLLNELSPGELNRLYLDYLFEEGYTAVAAVYILEHPRPEEISTSVLKRAEISFLESSNIGGVRIVSKMLKERGESLSPGSQNMIGKKFTMEELVSGTVTVFVDKGIKIERGVGRPAMEVGSGFFVDKKGYIITNHHVISSQVDPEYTGYTRLYVSLSGDFGEKIPAKVIGWDKAFDLALIKVEMDAPYVYSFSENLKPEIGTTVTAIGSPLGLTRTVTRGTLSAVGRELLTLGTVYQVDAPINPGNSGGPLLDDSGEVMGIVFAGAEQYEGINFAIPGEYAKRILSDLYRGGEVKHSWLGIAGNKDLKNIETLYTVPNSPAEYAGIQKGDYILSINDEPVSSVSNIQETILKQRGNTLLKVKWKRGDEVFEKWMALTTMPESPIETILKLDYQQNLFTPIFGMDVESIGNNEARVFTYKRYRVTKVYPGGIADSNGFSKDDTIILRNWQEDYKKKTIIAVVIHKGLKSGGLETILQLGSYMKSNSFY